MAAFYKRGPVRPGCTGIPAPVACPQQSSGLRLHAHALGCTVLLPSLDQPFYRDEHLFVHLCHQVVMLDGETVPLHPIEYRLLALLVKHAGEVVPRAIILKQILGRCAGYSQAEGGSPHPRGAEKTRGLWRPIHRNGRRGRVPFPAISSGRGLGLSRRRKRVYARGVCVGRELLRFRRWLRGTCARRPR
jgi:hypothetical protein